MASRAWAQSWSSEISKVIFIHRYYFFALCTFVIAFFHHFFFQFYYSPFLHMICFSSSCIYFITFSHKNRRSESLAKERGCSHTFVLASGKYSAAVFDKLGHKMVGLLFKIHQQIFSMSFKQEHCYDQTQVKSVAYADFVDARGELLLKDTREHTHTKVFLKEL